METIQVFEKVQYIRTKGLALKDNEGKFIPNDDGVNKRTRGQKKGVLVAFIDETEPEKVCLGYSLCHPRDRFDYKAGVRVPGLGKQYAKLKALKNVNNVDFALCQHKIDRQMPKTFVKIPRSIQEDLASFIIRCKKYYKDKEMPTWAEDFVKL